MQQSDFGRYAPNSPTAMLRQLVELRLHCAPASRASRPRAASLAEIATAATVLQLISDGEATIPLPVLRQNPVGPTEVPRPATRGRAAAKSG